MCLQNLVEERNEIYGKICDHLSKELTNLMVMGENMAECATNISGHGYSAFILARDAFLHESRKIQGEIDSLNIRTSH